jgi:SAM-dependent methyltransferase
VKQNKYDEPAFFAAYSQMPRSVDGLEKAWEWSQLRGLLPDLAAKRVLDLGCGYGWHCRYAREVGAAAVIGVDLSERMLARARACTVDPGIVYRRAAMEELDFDADEFDVIFSSLALHYVARIEDLFEKSYRWLKAAGVLAFSVEHPMFTARAEQNWCVGAQGERLHWPVDKYQQEGRRQTNWLAPDVIKYHRTVATYVNALLDCGFRLTRLLEPAPPEEFVRRHPELCDEWRRPAFLVISAEKS